LGLKFAHAWKIDVILSEGEKGKRVHQKLLDRSQRLACWLDTPPCEGSLFLKQTSGPEEDGAIAVLKAGEGRAHGAHGEGAGVRGVDAHEDAADERGEPAVGAGHKTKGEWGAGRGKADPNQMTWAHNRSQGH